LDSGKGPQHPFPTSLFTAFLVRTMGQKILALLGGSLFIPLAVAYILALASGVGLMLRDSSRGQPPRE
jgi:uncharacterized membrane protein